MFINNKLVNIIFIIINANCSTIEGNFKTYNMSIEEKFCNI